ncbi:hypothetical protein ABFX02_12G167500 [Erythranthe guttata]|uniref:methyl-CpG-binding domain-containing protein 2-like n=1 Tax=Erythranthe guttata TaxID=4155 RepID=UPI00064DE38F|nr:PREDICTED: methyl-CpG-binding domain-containing protein 2-like [Erythranthe guttata]|eukprot:XP_012850393.1 PREDICTED: methyl-CpG-binding domain-containing protein 2-like [Erythranthe guttata]
MPLKLTIKLKNEKTADSSSTVADQPSSVEGLPGATSSPASCQDQGDLTSAREVEENQVIEDPENESENSGYQMVVYNPVVADASAANELVPEPSSIPRENPFANRGPRIVPTVGAFTVQCANCFKWRLIPTKEKYEEIREHIIEQPFYCETGREWRPDISCEDAPDITQDGSRLWAIDKPNIAQPPPGWQRLLRIRGEGSTKFADVYYVAPTGKRLRSMVEVQKYLAENTKYAEEGVRLSQFSFQIPRPLQENYVRKRTARTAQTTDFNPLEVRPLAWVNPDEDDAAEYPDLDPEIQSAKRQRSDGDLVL